MRINILGSGDAFGSGGRFNTFFHMETGGRQVLIDCGASAMISMRHYGVDPNDIDGIVISHLHGDHFGGLPFFLLYEQFESARERPLILAGPPGVWDRAMEALHVMFCGAEPEWRFPVEVIELRPGRADDVLGLAVEPFPVVHGPPDCYALRVQDGTKTFAYSGDTTWTDTLIEAARNADVFIMECYAYTGGPPKHTDWQTLKARLPELAARRILLTHMSEDMLARRDEVTVETLADGMVIEV
jgi:ribonuclease BN (tRNA processing enzyme)